MNQTKALYRLQRIDLELDARRARLREVTAALEQDSVLRQARADVASLQEALRPEEARVRDLNLEIQSVTTQSSQLSSRLYGGKVNNPKELRDIEGKIDELKRRHAQLENMLLETMIKVEEFQASLAAANARLGEIEAAHASEFDALTAEQHRLKREIKALKTERETAMQNVSSENLDLYQTLRLQKHGHAVAVLEGERCSYCRVDQTTTEAQLIRQGQRVIFCSSCGRILVAI